MGMKEPVRMTGRDALTAMLRAEGVRYVFGNPGTSESPFMYALESSPELHYVLVTQEGVALGMADAYARATGTPAFVNLHIETGLANGISLLHNARDGGTPMVLTAGNKDTRELAHGRTDLVEMVRQFTKWSAEINHPAQIPYALRRAFQEARTPPAGPTFLSFAADGLDGEAEVEIIPSAPDHFELAADPQGIEKAARLLANSSSPILLVGDRLAATGGWEEAVRLAERIGARVYSPFYAEMSFPTGHPLFLGMIRLGFPETRRLLAQADVVVAVGKIFSGFYMFSEPDLRYFDANSRLIHLDSDPQELGRSQPTAVRLLAHPRSALEQLCQRVEEKMSKSAIGAAQNRRRDIAAEKAKIGQQTRRRREQRWHRRPMTPERMAFEVAAGLPPDTLVANDAVTASSAVFEAIPFATSGSLYGARGGAIGWGMGGTLGLKLARPDHPVVGFVGDGSAMMTVQGLWTAATENLPVVYIVCNNGAYRVLKINMNHYTSEILGQAGPRSRYLGMDFPQRLDLAALAEAQGVYGRRIEDPEELAPAVRGAFELGRPALLDVIIDGSL